MSNNEKKKITDTEEVVGGTTVDGVRIESHPVDQYEIQTNTRYCLFLDDYRNYKTFATVTRVYEKSYGWGTRRCIDYTEDCGVKGWCYVDFWSCNYLYRILD